VAIMFALLLLLPQEDQPAAPPPVAPAPEWLDSIHGTLRLLHRARWTGDASDSDLFNSYSLRAGNPDMDLFSGSASGRFQSDLDGDRSVDGFSPFDSLSDSYRRATTAQVHTAYVDITNPRPGVRARAGRQILDELPEAIPMDGARAAVEVSKEASITAFGGRPVNYFESSPEGDWMFGAWIEARPWSGGKARLDYLHLEDENTFGLFRDDLVGIMAEHHEAPWLFNARATFLESEARDILVRGSTVDPDAGFTLDVKAYYLFEQQQALSFGLDAFAVFLLPVEPYYQLSVAASKELTDRFGLDASVAARRLEHSGDEGAYNHEFSRWSFTVRAKDWPDPGWSASVTGDFWQTDGDDFWTAGGAMAWQVAEAVKAELSSAYALYSIDAVTGEERERSRSVSLGLRWKVNADVRADVRFTAEKNDIDEFMTLDIGARYAF
jgi:hypothetical protein